ncbi:MAG: response regulator, partial [bacterium]|nr:response regulator [bacterium]
EPFFSTKIEGKGLGLGLSTVYGIVQHSGGFIDVESSLETGTSFNLYFPKIKKDASELYEKSQLINLDMGKEIVLLVEKDEFVRSIMSRILDNKGYFVVETNNPGEALLLCENKEKPIKLIITDLFMPLISGVELVRRVRTFFPEISILYTSTHNQESIISEKYLNESNYFIQKPFDPDDFSLLV